MLVTSIPTRRLPFPCGKSRLEQTSKCKALTGGNIQRSWREIKQARCEQRGPLGQPTIVTSLILNYAHFAGRKRSGSTPELRETRPDEPPEAKFCPIIYLNRTGG